MKIDALAEVESSCDCDTDDVGDAYDVDDGSVFRSDNNRLMYYETWDVSGESSVLVSTTWVVYGGDLGRLRPRRGWCGMSVTS